MPILFLTLILFLLITTILPVSRGKEDQLDSKLIAALEKQFLAGLGMFFYYMKGRLLMTSCKLFDFSILRLTIENILVAKSFNTYNLLNKMLNCRNIQCILGLYFDVSEHIYLKGKHITP